MPTPDLEDLLCSSRGASSASCRKFVARFSSLTLKTVKSNLNRRSEWKVLVDVHDDGDEGGVTVAEVDLWSKARLVRKYGRVAGNGLWRRYRPCFGLAFELARKVGGTGADDANADANDDGCYVHRAEFRLLCAYLCIYAAMLDAFYRISEEGQRTAGDDDDDEDDNERRIDREAWMKSYGRVKNDRRFVALADLAEGDDDNQRSSVAAEIFDSMDTNGAGHFRLGDWCAYLCQVEILGGTELGRLLRPGDRSHKQRSRRYSSLRRSSAKKKANDRGGSGTESASHFSSSSRAHASIALRVTSHSGHGSMGGGGGSVAPSLKIESTEGTSSSRPTATVALITEYARMGSRLDVIEFTEAFAPLAERTRKGKALRSAAWPAADPNGNGLLSLSECDAWVRYALTAESGTKRGEALWKKFRPACARAFQMARGFGAEAEEVVGDDVLGYSVGGTELTSDDYVVKKEFRLFCAYLCLYAKMLDAFDIIDHGYYRQRKEQGQAGSGRDFVGDHDRRIELSEWTDQYPNVASYGFVALANVYDPQKTFREMDADGQGMVLFSEWCNYIEDVEVREKTVIGVLLAAVKAEKKANRNKRKLKAQQQGNKRTTTKSSPQKYGPSEDLQLFLATFEPFSKESNASQEWRRKEWLSIDANGNGLVSLAEVDRWIKYTLISKHKKAKGEDVWRAFRPCFIRAYDKARDVAPDESVKGAMSATTDDYISKREFRLLLVYLCAYARMLDAFAMIDNGGRAVADEQADRRIELHEWLSGYVKVQQHGFVALGGISDPKSTFKEIDSDEGGMILLGEWCRYLEDAEIKAKTPMGEAFSIAIKARKAKTANTAQTDTAKGNQPSEPVGPTDDVKDFVACLSDLQKEGPEGREAREHEWFGLDANGNGLVSLAEVDRWIKHTLVSKCKRENGERLWRLFRPCFIRAFNKARDVAPDESISGAMSATTDDYISKREFRLLVVYLCAYAKMLDAFAIIDGGGAGVDANDDRRIELHEWLSGYKKVEQHGFVALEGISDPNGTFKAMDSDGGGMILLGEWCQYLEDAEVKEMTHLGEKFLIAIEARKLNATKHSSPVRPDRAADAVGPTDDVKDFLVCFSGLGVDSPEGRVAREHEWLSLDANGNGLASLAEMDRWINHTLISKCRKERGERLWHLFRPCYIRAFNKARDVAPDESITGALTATTDDYISKREFRLLVVFLCAYARMLDAFAMIDGGGAGVDANDDRRIELHEWLAGYKNVEQHGFVALEGISDPKSVFKAMDSDEGGMILLGEWCRYLEDAEVKEVTPLGEKFAIAIEARKANALKPTRLIQTEHSPQTQGPTDDVKDFLVCFFDLGVDSPEGRVAREHEWLSLDANGNGLASLAEVDRWINHSLVSKCRKERGERLWHLFRPCYIRAFNKARDVAPDESISGALTATTDDYISKREFRLLVVFLCAYARMLDAFAIIDGGGAGVDANDDRRIELHEWLSGYKNVEQHGFVALESISDPKGVFKAMDSDEGGMILLGEWCQYLESAEVKAKTPLGGTLATAIEAKKAKMVNAEKAMSAVSHQSAEPVGPTDDVKEFVACINSLEDDTPEGREAREREWLSLDANGNGLVSLAEVDRWIKHTLISKCRKDRGEELWHLFRPCFIKSFNRARDVAPDESISGAITATTDDYISKREFRLLVVYLCAYAKMLDAFATIDGGGAGVDANDDRRIELHEWLSGYKKVEQHGFVALRGITDAKSVFKAMDTDEGGMILLGEWCRYLEDTEIKARTPMGENFAIAIETRRAKTANSEQPLAVPKIHPSDSVGPTADVKEFVACLSELEKDSLEGREAREREWLSLDANGNGLVSLAEVDRWIKVTLISKRQRHRGDFLWRLFRPCYLRAFNKARDVAPDESISGAISASTDDFISKREFRLLIVYICAYAKMLDAFAMIDGGGSGVDANDDRRIELHEWLSGYKKVERHGFVALESISNPKSVFESMDSDKGGMILLGEWCRYLEGAEVRSMTPLGEKFAIGIKSREAKRGK